MILWGRRASPNALKAEKERSLRTGLLSTALLRASCRRFISLLGSPEPAAKLPSPRPPLGCCWQSLVPTIAPPWPPPLAAEAGGDATRSLFARDTTFVPGFLGLEGMGVLTSLFLLQGPVSAFLTGRQIINQLKIRISY